MTEVTQGSIPEVVERTLGESLTQRTSILENVDDLGPPDMVHLVKTSRSTIGTFFYYTGADVSNSATISALLSHLAMIVGEKPQLWFGRHKSFKVTEATYCSYNAFSSVDARVKVGFPGAVESTMIDSQGSKVVESESLWLETFVSAMVRALIASDNDSSDFNSVVEIRRINPLINAEITKMFLDGFEKLFFEGSKLGCSENLQVATNGNNYLVDAFLKCVDLTGEYDQGLEIISRLKAIDPSVGFIAFKLAELGNQEVKAVKLMHDGLAADPLDGEMLSCQAQFCLEKNRLDLALPIATKAVNSSPSYFKPWSILVQVYIALGEYEEALLTLNSCPMVTHKEKYVLKRINNPRPEDMHLPLPVDVTLDKVSTLNSVDVAMEHNKVDPNLVNLPAANLKSTFADAYSLLSQIVHKTGWEQLLKFRTKVFVMEEEFKQGSTTNGDAESEETDGGESANGRAKSPTKLPEATLADHETQQDRTKDESNSNFKNKRLCERWLDNLFMLLYGDLRVYTMYKAELMHFEAQRVDINKSTLEWELTGLVADRLGHKNEAAKCFARAITQRFAPRSTRKLLEYCMLQRNKTSDTASETEYNDRVLDYLVHLLVWNHRWYSGFSPELILALRDLVNSVGRIKVESEVKVRFDDGNTGVSNLVQDNISFLDTYSLIETEDL